jgi:hypothetical protein
MQKGKTNNWNFVVWGAIVITLLSVYPQLVMWSVRGREWNGSFAETDGDEWAYSAYVQSLIDGRPRRNDPYTGREDQTGHPEPESLFSIQFLPAYMIAAPAQLLGVSASTAFMVLGVLAPLFSYLAIFWLIDTLTGDHRLAAAVIACGSLFWCTSYRTRSATFIRIQLIAVLEAVRTISSLPAFLCVLRFCLEVSH